MFSSRRLIVLLLLVAAGLSLAAKLPLDPEGAALSWNLASTRGAARAKGVGRFRTKGEALVNLAFGPGQSWSAELFDDDGFLPMSGTWTRKQPTSRRLKLLMDADTVAALETSYATQLELALQADVGINLEIDFALASSRMLVILKPKLKAGTATARLNTRFRFVGTSTGFGVVDAPSKATLRVRGLSDEVTLDDLMTEVE
ncbi:MAG: hypothetical protein DRQ55_15480 [Planctomycetota bacterium]|nr:MAG: hypothetical protein DRQ55_15480 [Planctomycetota bacterium]